MKLKLYPLGFSSCDRHLEHSTIIYEDPQHSPLLRLSWNKQDPNYLATFSLDALEVCHFAHVIKYNHTYINIQTISKLPFTFSSCKTIGMEILKLMFYTYEWFYTRTFFETEDGPFIKRRW